MSFPTISVSIPYNNFVKSIAFAEQLVLLDENQYDKAMPKAKKGGVDVVETRDVADPMYISEWLLTSLSNKDSKIVTGHNFPEIVKKVRDDVIYKGGDFPFRRSGLWMTMKVVLQLNLEKELRHDAGKCIFKMIIIHFASKMCEFLLSSEYRTIDTGLAMQMLAKLGRKLDKLSTKWESSVYELRCESLYSLVTSNAKEIIIKVREKVNEQFSELNASDRCIAQLKPLDEMNFQSDTIHKVPSLSRYLQTRLRARNSISSTYLPEPHVIPRHRLNDRSFPNLIFSSDTNIDLLLADVESWILENFDNFTTKHVSHLRDLAIQYGVAAKQHYKDDPLGGSRMILTILAIIQILDQMAVEEYPLLEEHNSGINPRIIQDLLLPSRDRMRVALALENYFDLRNSESKYPALNAESKVSERSFAARFAKANSEMSDLRQKILDEQTERIEKKMNVVNRGRMKVQKWREEIQGLEHEFVKYWSTYEYRTKHEQKCKRCKLTKQITSYNIRIYERALKNEEHCQYAVAFELLIPSEISCLRDVLQFAADEFFFPTKSGKELNIQGDWIDYDQISSHKQDCQGQRRVNLGSYTLLYLKSHYTKIMHIDADDSAFIVNNGYNCVYYGPDKTELFNNIKKQSVKRFCTFSVDTNSPYRNLQWTLAGTSHFQNQVLASQNECAIELTLSEYVSFGSLRSDGHRLQMRNIYRALATESLSFEKESVVALILQSLWQAGPNSGNIWIRESHEDLRDEVFASEMLELLNKYLTIQENNWKHPSKMMIAILIAIRILELNDENLIIEKAVSVLLYSRSICDDWMTRIQKAKSRCDCKEVKQIQSLRLNMVDVGICCALTFYASPKLKAFPQLWQSTTVTSALNYWLNATVNVNNNIDLDTIGKSELSNLRRIFLREMRIIGINSETLLLEQITKGFSTETNRFVATQWPGVQNGIFKQWKSFPKSQQVVYTELVARGTKADTVETNHIEIDVILGTFLVNGMPVSGLSEAITRHPLFKRVFGSTIFEVQPTQNGTFCTRFQYNDCNYSFKMDTKQLIVKEIRSNGETYELIPNEEFDVDIPSILQDEYSHWWSQNEQRIEFRPVKFNVDNFSNSDHVEYELDLETRFLIELKTSRNVIDRLSNSFMQISAYLQRLEKEGFIIATIQQKTENVIIELPRMRIQFKLDESNEIISHEYNGMRISRDQKFGTFIGLKNGLLLEHKENGERLIIMPHGEIVTRTSTSSHPDIWITTETLREPPFFVYDIDNRCQQLKARGGFSAWFYLAHLHAVTSYPLPDPFTGMRGTEKALQILQSPFCWSSEPYDSESITTLTQIGQLSPSRMYHPPHQNVMQKIRWSHKLPSSSCHEAYRIVVDRLIQDSEGLKFLHGKGESDDAETDERVILNERSYRRYLCYDPNAVVNKYFIEDAENSEVEASSDEENCSIDEWTDCESGNITEIQSKSSNETSDNCNYTDSYTDNKDDVIKNMRIIAAFGHSGHKFHVPPDCEYRLNNLLYSGKDLHGLSDNIIGTNLVNDMNSNLRDIWINLFDIASNQKLDQVKFTLALTLLALNGNNLFDLLTLQVVATNPMKFVSIQPPNVESYTNLLEANFDRAKIDDIVLSCAMTKETYLSRFEHQFKEANPSQSQSLLLKHSLEWNKKHLSQSNAVAALIENQWPCSECDLSTIDAPEIYIHEVINKVNPILELWYNNAQLKLFLAKVNETMHELSTESTPLENLEEFEHQGYHCTSRRKYKINFDEKIAQNFDENVEECEIKLAEQLFNEGKYIEGEDDVNDWWQRIKQLCMPNEFNYLEAANIYPRMVPTLILPQMLSATENQKKMIGALGVLFSLDQRSARIKKLEQQQPYMEVGLRREKEEIPFSNWLPCTYPQWLLFEIEMNLTIRRIQIEVAKKMIDPVDNKHSVMQLNMGEGKTAVIVPLLCAVLSNEKHVCQVTVLKSLFQSNLKTLRQCLGGMLNRRIFTFPCRRDMIKNEGEAKQLLESYHQCLQSKGVIMTLPEYRLSLQLKLYETARKGQSGIAAILFQIREWVNQNVRNILDESDAILNPKYQLIYTVGEQLPLDGGELRWIITQNILKRIPANMLLLWKKYGNEKIELDQHFDFKEWPEKFAPCRILHSSVYEELQNNIANDFIEERTGVSFPKLKTSQKELVKTVLIDRTVNAGTYDECMKIFEDYPVYQDVIYLLSGLLKFEVLHLVLKKRWRVNYGVNPNGHRKMAVPFIAKDVCAENTEFGHPDVAIAFTYLSYYYSGLTDEQLSNCFETLSKFSNSDDKYKEWIADIPSHRVDKSIRTYSGINLSDSNQRLLLFTLLRYNMNVIDFWLSNVVFPREAKQFNGKMMCTAWDLCSEDNKNVVTGFSGTNDTKLLLPEPICQNDLDELEDTNENVRKTIIKVDNDNYAHLESNISGLEILEKLAVNRIPVLLDAGALMLELNNEQVAEEWLKLVAVDQFDAAVYFNDKNLLMVVDRQNCQRLLDFSPYINRLDRCLIYLDDAHTRGTDLKFPTGMKACVTLW